MLLSLVMLAAVVLMVREHWHSLGADQLAILNNRALKHFGSTSLESDVLLRKWVIQGIAVPTAVWAIWNMGLIHRLPPIMPNIALAQYHDQPWSGLWLAAVVKGFGLITLTWGAITYIWMTVALAQAARDVPLFRKILLTVGIPMFLLSLILMSVHNWALLPTGLLIVFMPVVICSARLVHKETPVPSYSAAVAKINFGKYEDAELEVINQLEKRETDFQGWMMLAELYATKYRRFDDAAQVIIDLCNDPSVQEVEISVACNKLADWQLELAENPPAARAALDLLIKSLPGTHFAQMAKVRMKQLPRTREDLEDEKKRRGLRLPALREEFDKAPEAAAKTPEEEKREASLEANRLSDRLRENPNDHATRERLAILLAERLGHVNLGVEQLRLIMKMPEVSAENAAKHLAQIANWERRLNKNEAKFRALLAEITRDYSGTTASLAARRQLQLIENESLATPTPTAARPASIRIRAPEA